MKLLRRGRFPYQVHAIHVRCCSGVAFGWMAAAGLLLSVWFPLTTGCGPAGPVDRGFRDGWVAPGRMVIPVVFRFCFSGIPFTSMRLDTRLARQNFRAKTLSAFSELDGVTYTLGGRGRRWCGRSRSSGGTTGFGR